MLNDIILDKGKAYIFSNIIKFDIKIIGLINNAIYECGNVHVVNI